MKIRRSLVGSVDCVKNLLLLLHLHCLSYFHLAGASETVVLNMSTLVWSVVTSVEGRVPLASEVFHILQMFVACKMLYMWQISIWIASSYV